MTPVSAGTRQATKDSAKPNEGQPGKQTAAKGKGKGKSKGKIKAKRPMEDAEEENNDSGRNSSKNFFTQASKSKKRKLNASTSREEIQGSLNDFLKMLEQEAEEESSSNLAHKLREHLSPDLKEIMICDNDYRSHARDMPKCKPLDSALAFLSQISKTLDTYHFLSKDVPVDRPSKVPEWKHDHKSLVTVNEHALRIAARQVNSMVIPGKKLDEMPEGLDDVEKLAWEVMEKTRPANMEKTWGAIAKRQFEAFMGLLEMAVAN